MATPKHSQDPQLCKLGEKGRRIRELTSSSQKIVWKNSVELFAEKVNNRGLCAIAKAESLRYKLLGGLAVSEKGSWIRELTSVVQKRFKFPENSVELFAKKVNNRGLCAIAQAESLRYKLLGGLAVRSVAMDPSLSANVSNATRKVKFAPKGPPRREKKLVVPKPEKIENDIDSNTAQGLLQRLNENALKAKPKSEKKDVAAPVRVAFGQVSSDSKSYGHIKFETKKEGSSNGVGTEQRVEKEYKEPWDYYSSYPVTLPMRRPYSGNPELLDEQEFGEASRNSTYDEQSLNPAVQLGLTEKNTEESLIFFQLPTNMPMPKPSITHDTKETNGSSKVPQQKGYHLNELPAGFMGKMLVYKSGTVKLKLGDTLYDVSAGLDSVFAQDVAAINTKDKQCCILGELNKRAIVTPDVDAILDGISDL